MAAVEEGGYPPAPPALPALREPLRHPILEKGAFEQLHRNAVVEARPHIVHFGGFQLHKEHTHVVKIINTSPSSMRVSIIAPHTQYFRISFDKKGLLAPGMSEDISIKFIPHEWRYYYDTVKIFCGDLAENLVVPIHAYPSANDIKLPRIIDFGQVAIGTTKTKTIPLSCKIPISFEFEIEVVESHPDFRISPLLGAIPADGTSEVTVSFTPSRHRTSRAEVLFQISQFDFDPVLISIVGSSIPDLNRDEIVKSAAREVDYEDCLTTQDMRAGKIGKLKKTRHRGALEVVHPTFKIEESSRALDGFCVPTTGFDAQATNFVLNQTAGKLPLKDLTAFIRSQRAELQAMRVEQEEKAKQEKGGTLQDVGAEEDDDRQALELRFDMLYREVEMYDREKELRNCRACGEDEPNAEEVQRVLDSRQERHERHAERRMLADASRVESVLSQGKVSIPTTYRPSLVPAWDENANDTFGVRLQVIDRFLRTGAKVLMRLRADRRARALMEAVRAAGVTDRASCRAWVEEETKAARSGSKGRTGPGGPADRTRKSLAGGAGTAGATGGGRASLGGALSALAAEDAVAEVMAIIQIPEDFVLPMSIPTSRSGLATEDRQPVEVVPLGNFREFLPAPINPRMDCKVFDYPRYAVPPAAAYMRPHQDACRLQGALEEHSVRGPRGNVKDGAEEPLDMPESCLLPPCASQDPMCWLVPSTECRTYIALPDAVECDPEYQLAQTPPSLGPLLTENLLPENIMSFDTPWLAAFRPRRQIGDPFQHFDPAPPCFAEAGGAQGPRLGCDAGGERLSFMPVGGFERDLPSDTDDDECGDFELSPPGEEEYLATLKSLDAPLTSERWRKEQEAEERMHDMCAANNKAVRDRITDLNEVLGKRHKVYQG